MTTKADCQRTRRRCGFTLLEVIIALAMLALIAVPAVGLATMAVGRNKELLLTGNASELKNRVDTALRAYDSGGTTIFSNGFVDDDTSLSFVASEDLLYIEVESDTLTVSDGNDKYYQIVVREPVGYDYSDASDAYRIVTYEVVWPYQTPEQERNQVFFTSVFRK